MSELCNPTYIALKVNSEIKLQQKRELQTREMGSDKEPGCWGYLATVIRQTYSKVTALPQMFNRDHFTTLQFKSHDSTPDLATDKMEYNLSRASRKSIALCQLFYSMNASSQRFCRKYVDRLNINNCTVRVTVLETHIW